MLKGGDDAPILPNQAGGGDSMLQGGEQAQIMPNQAGGAGEPPTWALDKDFSPEEENQIKAAAATAYIENNDPNLTPKQRTDLAIKAANDKAETILNNGLVIGDITYTADEDEKNAARAAVIAAKDDPRFEEEFKSDEEKAKAAHRVAVATIIRIRKKKNLEIVAANAQRKAERLAAMTTPSASEIIALETTIVYTELYHITDYMATNEMDKFRQIILEKHSQMNDEVAFQKMRVNMYGQVDKYRQVRLKEWSSVYKNTNEKVTPLIPRIQENAQYNDKEILTIYSRFIYCFKWNLDKIVVIPPIKGDTILFAKVLYRLAKIGALTHKKIGGKDRYKIKTGIAIVFMPSFYADMNIADEATRANAIKSNLILFSIFLEINYLNTNKIFILSENTANNYNVGVMFANSFSKHDILKSSPLTMLEPSYIIYPYARSGIEDGIVLSASAAAEPALPKINKFGLADLKKTSIYGNALGLSVKPNGTNDAESLNIFAIKTFEDLSGVKEKINQTVNYNLSYRPGPCDGLINSPELSKLEKDGNIFYLKPMDIKKSAAEETVFKDEYALMVIQLNPEGDHNPLCTTALTSAPEPLGSDDKHVASDKAKPGNNNVQIEIRGTLYSIREGDKNVVENWKKREFTEDEATFLNSTRLRPGVLQGCFGDSWPESLSTFLETFTNAKCMSDISLLTKSECYICRKFLEDVNVYFINNQLQLELSNPEFDQYAKEIYENTEEPPYEIHADHAREANPEERDKRKQFFGTMSSYDHIATGERRAFIIGVNKKTLIYKYYIVSVQSNLSNESRADDEKELEKKILNLEGKYKDIMFIY